jgi:hypothetical protein
MDGEHIVVGTSNSSNRQAPTQQQACTRSSDCSEQPCCLPGSWKEASLWQTPWSRSGVAQALKGARASDLVTRRSLPDVDPSVSQLPGFFGGKVPKVPTWVLLPPLLSHPACFSGTRWARCGGMGTLGTLGTYFSNHTRANEGKCARYACSQGTPPPWVVPCEHSTQSTQSTHGYFGT